VITQIKKWGDSKVLILTPEFIKFHELEVGDWVDIEDIVKIRKIQEGTK
jgi:antitoxin component of MazEF toxin-antitoxin module